MSFPSVPDSFEWAQQSWGAALRCPPLGEVAPHLFTTRQLELTSPADRQALAAALGAGKLAMLKQVHGADVIVASGDLDASREGDALIASDPEVAVAIRVADCVPLLMADRATGAVAAVHAGWRGTAARVAGAAIEALRREFGTTPENIVAAIGPSIGPCCYEVGPELVDAFAAAGHERYLIDRWFVAGRPPARADSVPPRTRSAATLRLDVPGANRDQLILAGVPEAQIHVSGLCTAMHLDVLTSYRVEKENAGRMVGAIRAGTGDQASGSGREQRAGMR
jgi:YfiH family protein